MKKQTIRKKSGHRKVFWVIGLLFVLALLAVWIVSLVLQSRVPELADASGAQNPGMNQGEETMPDIVLTDTEEFEPIVLGQGLQITGMGDYAGIYMEDGSDEAVSDVMMILLENTSENDLQLARIRLTYPDAAVRFEVTNLPAGESVVLLEQDRQSRPAGSCESAEAENVVFFAEPMGQMEDTFALTSRDGSIEIQNISGEEISGIVYIYYKNSASDLLYGGITYRARWEGTLAPQESARILTGHYSPDTCRILQVTYGG